jgi:hypothetical protein
MAKGLDHEMLRALETHPKAITRRSLDGILYDHGPSSVM